MSAQPRALTVDERAIVRALLRAIRERAPIDVLWAEMHAMLSRWDREEMAETPHAVEEAPPSCELRAGLGLVPKSEEEITNFAGSLCHLVNNYFGQDSDDCDREMRSLIAEAYWAGVERGIAARDEAP